MTQEEKQLLLIDLCARLPYDVQCEIGGLQHGPYTFTSNDVEDLIEGRTFKPYLRPMSSLTEEEIKTIDNISNKGKGFEEDEDGWIRCDSIHTKWGVWPDGCAKLLDYLNSIHIDYRGLIEKGLALEAPEDMYNKK